LAEIDFLSSLHTSTKRDYVQRVVDHDKAHCAEVARKWDADYWDGERQYGYGGYKYDGRWRSVAEEMAAHYGLKAGDRILDIGCGKAFLLYEFTQVVPGIDVTGIDISKYAIEHAKEEVKPYLYAGDCMKLPFDDGSFDFVFSLNVFHNLRNFELIKAVQEAQRVRRGGAYLCVESYRNESEKVNLLYWQLTCRSFMDTEEWGWEYRNSGYDGDYGFIFFT